MYFKYLWYILKHKYFVFIECCKVGLYWRGFVHDLSKLYPSEFIPYAKHFYEEGKNITSGRDKTGYYKAGETGDLAMDLAWSFHQKRNKHHFQFWVLIRDLPTATKKSHYDVVFDMPLKYVKEMICDWRGAGRAQKNKTTTVDWYIKNREHMILSDSTRIIIEELLKDD